MDRFQIPYEILDRNEIQSLEPALAPIFNFAIFQRDSLHITDPKALIQSMADQIVENGGTYKKLCVEQINISKDYIEIANRTESIRASKLVIATGAYSEPLVTMVGDKVSLAAERGYHMMFPQATGSLLSRPVVNGESSFVLSPMQTGMRMTSQVEIANTEASPDYRRIRKLTNPARRMLPDLDLTEKSIWMGCRPSLPDSLPVISTSPNSKKVIYAFGHQHLGMTLGPVTAYLVEQLIKEVQPELDLHPYRISR